MVFGSAAVPERPEDRRDDSDEHEQQQPHVRESGIADFRE
jgi:hypothetical protein